ncbi:flavodoxin domain-containing protein [Hydrogenophaga sp.]|uniref:flavodoxin domain-containing protein n=1 Tax=Hydrogenophaga sp. TaxID=1904254 RepID=UPI00260EC16D|nr:flavodoxin domain-containing protein [Hydrogenophaga sp.]MCW5652299.1 flavodoxin domain-containing protein [Hydrogenophaga sp.]
MTTPDRLIILVGSVTDNALHAAQAIAMDGTDLIPVIEVRPMDGLDTRVFDEDALFLICTSTHGAGDVPENARALYESLDSAPRYLGHVRYGVVALGDSAYPQTFCNGGLRFDERLSDLGAQRLGDVFRHDASMGTDAAEQASAWCRDWLSLVRPAAQTIQA